MLSTKNIVISFAIILLVACNIILFYTSHKTEVEFEKSVAGLYPYVQRCTFLEETMDANIHYAKRRIDDVEVTDRSGQKKMLSQCFDDSGKPLFVVRVSDRYCNSSVKYCLDLFDDQRIICKKIQLVLSVFPSLSIKYEPK